VAKGARVGSPSVSDCLSVLVYWQVSSPTCT